MKMIGIKIRLIQTPPPHAGGELWYTIRIDTDEGIYGLGESMPHFAFHGMEDSYRKLMEGAFDRWYKGKDPFLREQIYRQAYNVLCAQHPDMLGCSILSAIDMAMWDICGKALGKPVYDLLGGACRDRLRSYSYISRTEGDGANYSTLWGDPKVVCEMAAPMLEDGFTALKYDPLEYRLAEGIDATKPFSLTTRDVSVTLEILQALHELFDGRCDIIMGTHGQLTTSAAIQYAKLIEPFSPLWFEEPIPPENMEEMARVRHATSVPIAAGERIMTVYEAARAMETGAVSVLQPDIGTCGGITSARKMAAVAEAHYVDVSPHLWGGPILFSAAVQVSLSIPNFMIQECIGKAQGFYRDITTVFATWDNGYIYPSNASGLGVELDEAYLERITK